MRLAIAAITAGIITIACQTYPDPPRWKVKCQKGPEMLIDPNGRHTPADVCANLGYGPLQSATMINNG